MTYSGHLCTICMITYSKLYSYVSLSYPNMDYNLLKELAKQFYDNI